MSPAEDQTNEAYEYLAQSECDTDTLGAMLAQAAEPGLVVGLIGQLGAGKTRFVRAAATALGADAASVNSPTFVLIQEYFGRIPVFHFDTYRLRDVQAFADLGAEEYFGSDGICFVEWADRVNSELPQDVLQIEIFVIGPTLRKFRITARGPMAHRVLLRLTNSIESNR